MTHLRKGLAAAETVNLHFVQARDLHCGAEMRPPLAVFGPLFPRWTQRKPQSLHGTAPQRAAAGVV